VGQEQIRPDHAWHGGLEGCGALKFDNTGRFAKLKPTGDPLGLSAFNAFAVEEVGGLVELQEHPSELLDIVGQLFPKRKRGGGDAPVMAGKESACGHVVAHE